MSQRIRRGSAELVAPFVFKALLVLAMASFVTLGLPRLALADDGGFEVNGTAVTLGADETWASRFVTAVKDSNTTSIKLTADLQIPDTVDYFELAGTDVSIDLNGHTLSMAGDSRIVVNSGHSLTLKGTTGDGSKGQLVGSSRTNREVIEYNGGNLTLEGLTASSASQPLVKMGTGAGILTISGCTIKDSSTGGQSVITALGGTLNVTSSTFSGNTATNGGALYASGSTTVNINEGTTFTNNTATNEGGAIKAENGVTVNINGGTISSNTAASNGGGVLVWNGNLTMTGGTITGNTSGSEGGGIYFGGNDSGHTLTISGGTISSNTAKSEAWGTGGGGVCARGGNNKFTLIGGTITGNFAQGSGGGILNATDFFHMTGGSVTNNTADLHEGGGITLTGTEGLDTNTALIEAGTITGNKTGYKADGTVEATYQDWGGGGVFVSDKATLMVPHTTQVTGNDAGGFGGGIAGCSTARLYILDNTAVYGNTAKGTNASGAGSVKQEDHKYALDNETFMANGYQDIFSAFSSYVTQDMPGGTENWSGSVDGQVLKSGTDPIVSSSALGLTAGSTSSNTSWQLVVNNNSSATHGGGILVNGTAMFGNSKEITVGASVEFNAIKTLLDADGNDLSSALVTVADDGTQTGHATFAISTSEDKTDASAVFSTGELRLVDGSYQVLFDRRPTFDDNNCTGAGPWTFTYYIYETGADSWMDADGTMYKVVLSVKKLSESQRIGTEDANARNFTKYRYEIDWTQSSVS